MSFRPMFGRPSAVALGLGVLTMVIVFLLGTLALNLAMPHWSFDASANAVVSLLFPLVVYCASGFVTGFAARRAPLMHGVLLGLLATSIFAGVTIVVAGELSGMATFRLAAGAMVIGSVGAFLGDVLARR